MAPIHKGECFCGADQLEISGEPEGMVIAIADHVGRGRTALSTLLRFGSPKQCVSLRARNILPRSKRQKPVSGNIAGSAVAIL